MNKSLLALTSAVGIALSAMCAQAAEIIPVVFDDPGEGYNDPTPVAPVGNNPGTTRGEQRRIVAQFAADLWGSVLQSDVPIYIGAQFNPLGANVLGSAGASTVHSNFAPGIVPDTWYSSALADAIGGVDLNPGFTDIGSQYSSDFDFYYGLDGKTPAGQVNFLDVAMHEFGHGLGFQNFVSEAAGTFLAGVPDIYSNFTFDNTTGQFWTQMTVPQRQASALNYGKVVFTGASATAGAGLILDPRTALRITAPAPIAGEYDYGTAGFGAPISPANFTGTVVLGVDPSDAAGASTTDGCSPLTNAAAVAGNIAIMDRGTCGFTIKVKNAQDAGAIGVIIADNVPGTPPPGLGGADPTITIPSIRVTLAAGNSIKANLPGVQVGLVVDPSKLQGADDDGRPRLFMPNPVQGGSSGSHYDTALLPNALMEPSINSTLLSTYNLDITPNLLQDTGWTLNDGSAQIDGCDTGIDLVDDVGIIIGANVQAYNNVCEASAGGGRAKYMRCMTDHATALHKAGLIDRNQHMALRSCVAKSTL
ncbi:PA domain-containing protein [Luteimonas cucumeris]|uniref:PA domain-containing protein n=1 Tax=Luteimonas cucumeris TaxID=985012 RepID=A0A562KXN3_9GAMM|nr:PA domain-containing protein [Luteimonas cucumeris]TWH99953.1 PA domain-containing protein [Luteimonas cucumeris]